MTIKKVYPVNAVRSLGVCFIGALGGWGWLQATHLSTFGWLCVLLTTLYGIRAYFARWVKVEIHAKSFTGVEQTKKRQSMLIHHFFSCPWLVIILGKGLYNDKRHWVLLSRICLNENDFIALNRHLKSQFNRV